MYPTTTNRFVLYHQSIHDIRKAVFQDPDRFAPYVTLDTCDRMLQIGEHVTFTITSKDTYNPQMAQFIATRFDTVAYTGHVMQPYTKIEQHYRNGQCVWSQETHMSPTYDPTAFPHIRFDTHTKGAIKG